jgi:hypothetical protein
MRWNKESKLKLYKILRAKLEKEGWVSWQNRPPYYHFLESFGIKKIQKIKKYGGPPWDTMRRESWVWCDPETKEPVNKDGHIIIMNPFYGSEPVENNWSPASGEGIQIPKEVADKLLVLGVAEIIFQDS